MTDTRDRFEALLRGEGPVPPVAELIGFRPTELGDGRAVFEMTLGEQHHNPMGTVHGGIFVDIADAAMGSAFASTLEAGESFTTLELDVRYLRPAWEGPIVARARVEHRGRTVGLVTCDVEDDDGRLLAKLSSTCIVLRGEAAEGR